METAIFLFFICYRFLVVETFFYNPVKCLFFGFHPFLPRETIFLSSGKHILLLFLFVSTNGNDFLTIREQLFYILDPFLIAEPFFYLVQKSFIFSFQLFALVETISLSKGKHCGSYYFSFHIYSC